MLQPSGLGKSTETVTVARGFSDHGMIGKMACFWFCKPDVFRPNCAGSSHHQRSMPVRGIV